MCQLGLLKDLAQGCQQQALLSDEIVETGIYWLRVMMACASVNGYFQTIPRDPLVVVDHKLLIDTLPAVSGRWRWRV